jgi:hypothetical protein
LDHLVVDLVAEGDGYCVALCRDLLIIDNRTTATVASLRAVAEAQARAQARSKKKLAAISIVGPGPLPDAEVRRVSEELNDADVPLVCIAIVIEMRGFVGSAIRGVITGLSLLKRSSFPRKVFDTSEAALPWLQQQVSGDASWLRDVQAALADVAARRPRPG